MTASELAQVIEQYHRALDEFVTGNPEPQKERSSRRDVLLASTHLHPGLHHLHDEGKLRCHTGGDSPLT